MTESTQPSPIYDEIVEQRGDAVAEARNAAQAADRQVEAALGDLRNAGQDAGWFSRPIAGTDAASADGGPADSSPADAGPADPPAA